ncbi:SDH family Clp fold serine proteinase [Shinella granuli]|uniref:Serine dehydrogenase proteinase n=1 Tax=Shinella granuli TaxID=323621 RepID=A0A4R2C5B5_SHIGR|nr:serine protease [Shinella granuli]TCN34935.1 serine dehydrogenase proteinase [Shinella granuli]
MGFAERKPLYEAIEHERNTKIISYVTGDRANAETQIGPDCIDIFVDALDAIGPTKKISLLLHTNGGNTAAAWRLVNLIKTFCDEFEVLIPYKAMSAGTLISLGAQSIVMTKQAALGPIDPSLIHPLGPQVPNGNQLARVPVSVEAVRGFLDAAKVDLEIKDDGLLARILNDLSNKVHPLVLGEIFRSRAQIRFLAEKLLNEHVQDSEKVRAIVDFLCADSGSHDYTINRREAAALSLPVEKPSADFYGQLKAIHKDYSSEMELAVPFNPMTMVAPNSAANYRMVRGLVESVNNGSFGFVSEGTMVRSTVGTPQGPQEQLEDRRVFEGWRAL